MFKACIDFEKGLEEVLGKERFLPLPSYSERDKWCEVTQEIQDYFLEKKEYLLKYEFKSLSATKYLRFSWDGNRAVYESEYFEKRRVLLELIILELIEAKGDCLYSIVDGIWNLCEESTWVIPAHNNHMQKYEVNKLPDVRKNDFIDLFSAETGALLGWAYYFFKKELDKISPLITSRLVDEIEKRIEKPYLQYDNMSWMGLDGSRVNNWNPWIVGNCLVATLLTQADEEKRKQLVKKSTLLLDQFLNQYKREYLDGGCDEGASYWNAAGACLFDSLEMLYEVTKGEVQLYSEQLILNIGEYIAKMHVSSGKFVNFADGSLTVPLSYLQIERFGKRVGSEYLIQFAKAMGQREKMPKISGNGYFTYRTLQDILDFKKEENKGLSIPYKKDIWLENLQVFCARTQDNGEGLFIAAKGGHNNESHNHNDIGSFIVYKGDVPILIDPGVETYTAKTFSPQRYELWTMQSAYHNVPTINGKMQCEGAGYKAKEVRYDADETKAIFILQLEETYDKEAGLEEFRRSISLDKQVGTIEIIDEIQTLREENEYVFNFMTLHPPVIGEEGVIGLLNECNKQIVLRYDKRLNVICETIVIEDEKMKKDWQATVLYRLQLRIEEKSQVYFKFTVEEV